MRWFVRCRAGDPDSATAAGLATRRGATFDEKLLLPSVLDVLQLSEEACEHFSQLFSVGGVLEVGLQTLHLVIRDFFPKRVEIGQESRLQAGSC